MSKVSEFPDESWSEEKILELLENNISGASADQGVRLVCLDELLKRRTIKQVDRIVEVLLEIAEVHGRSKTESPMIIELISRQANLEETAFKKLYDKMVSQNDNLCYCYARIIRKLEDVKKRKCMKRLLWLLMSYNSFSDVTDEMYQTLVTMDNECINKEIVEATIPYLRGPDTFKVVYAVRITSKLASEFLLEIEPVIERTLKGWYDGQHQVEILDLLTIIWTSVPQDKAMKLIKKDARLIVNIPTQKMIATTIKYSEEIEELYHFYMFWLKARGKKIR